MILVASGSGTPMSLPSTAAAVVATAAGFLATPSDEEGQGIDVATRQAVTGASRGPIGRDGSG